MNLTALRTEFLARGEDFLDSSGTTRQDYFLNEGYRRINEAEPWPWLFADASGTAPLTITDLQTVLSVVDATDKTKLTRLDRRRLLDADTDLTTVGTPQYWYRDSDTSLKVYPANTTITLNVRYLRVAPTLSTGTDTPILPTRYHGLIVDAAMIEAFKDSEDFSELSALEQVFQQRIAEMRRAYLPESGPDYIDSIVSGFIKTY